ncbi:MAG: phosphoribosylformylglycinamidine synthase subunit PurS [Leptonema sp. (in: bacteria)]
MLQAKIYISLKESILDPQGITIQNALHSLNFKEVEKVRMGKFIQLWLNTSDKEEAKKRVEEMCKNLLVNEVIETYKYEIL